VNFVIEGSFDGATWVTIISSERSRPTFRNWVTETHVPNEPTMAYERIRLRQTGKCARPTGNFPVNDYLVLSYVDFAGTIVYPGDKD
jgi:hypothetical protein